MPGAIRVWNEASPISVANYGTLTCVARSLDDPACYYAMGASHVLAPLADDDSSLVASTRNVIACQLPSESQKRVLGTLLNWSPLYARSTGFANAVDAAIVTIDRATAQQLLAQMAPYVALGDATDSAHLAFLGAATPAGEGTVNGRPTSMPVLCQSAHGDYEELMMSGVIPAAGIAGPGDSGSLLCNDAQEAVGMLLSVGVGEQSCYFGSLREALGYFRLQLVTADLLTASGAGAKVQLSFAVGDPADATDTLARTLWGEARSEPISGIRAVGAVVLNRASRGPRYWWGGTIAQVCRKPYQFSCWNANDPNLPKLKAVAADDRIFRECSDIAALAIAGGLTETRLDATHYHTRAVFPSWAKGRKPCAETRNHLFYNDIEPLAGKPP
jgi:hypothetical protein